MNSFPSQTTVKLVKKRYPKGCRVKLVKMNDPYNDLLKPGSLGTVTHVDDAGTIHVNWDCGSTLGVLYGEDICQRVLNNPL